MPPASMVEQARAPVRTHQGGARSIVGESDDVASEIAARTVNKERARAGEARESSKTSTDDVSSSRRGGLRSHSGRRGRTYDQLYAEAKDRGIKGVRR